MALVNATEVGFYIDAVMDVDTLRVLDHLVTERRAMLAGDPAVMEDAAHLHARPLIAVPEAGEGERGAPADRRGAMGQGGRGHAAGRGK